MIAVESALACAQLLFYLFGDYRQIASRAIAGTTASMPVVYVLILTVYWLVNLPVVVFWLAIEPYLRQLSGLDGWKVAVFEIVAIWILSVIFWIIVIRSLERYSSKIGRS
jgi:hypothetical protein